MPFYDAGNNDYTTVITSNTDTSSNLRWSLDTGTTTSNTTWATDVTFTYDTVILNEYRIPSSQPLRQPAAMPPVVTRHLKSSKEEKLAEILLLENLNEKQREEYKRLKSFKVIVKDKIYRIKRGRVGNIELIDDAGIVARYCVHPSIACPDEDTMLAQKLMLENDEKELLKLANVHFQRAA